MMDLFPPSPACNLLPCDGEVYSLGQLLDAAETRYFFGALLQSVPWKNDEVIMFGKRVVTARKVAWFGDAGLSYAYSGTVKHALAWTPELLDLKSRAEAATGESFNSCLLNFYQNGGEGMGWHSDDEKSLCRDSAIAALSLGAERKFSFRHKHLDLDVSVMLADGSLLVMRGETQRHWRHCLPKSAKVTAPRISLTFRQMIPVEGE